VIKEAVSPGGKSLALIGLGQMISLFGSELTSFGLGVWVYQRTGSVTSLAMIFACASIPGLLLSPVVGVYLDRWDRRRGLIYINLGAAAGPLALVALLLSHRLEVWSICVIVAFSSAFLSFHISAFGAAVTLLVPKQHFGRMSGMLQFGNSTAQVTGPLLAGLLVPVIHLQGLILLDFATFLVGILTLWFAHIPAAERSAAGRAAEGSVGEQIVFSWRYLRKRPGLLQLLAFFAGLNLLLGMCQILATPLVLARGTATELGLVLTLGGTGMILGALVMSAWGGPKKRILGVLGFSPVIGLGSILMGASPSMLGIAIGIFVLLTVIPIINGCDQAIWQDKVEADLQGRIFSTRQLLEQFTVPVGYLLAGPLADRWFEPLLRPAGPLAGTVGRVLGTGPGRGIGLQFVVIGLLVLGAASAGLSNARLRAIENAHDTPAALPEPTALGV
jgi:DHA3 family macrolide efflux protein-like MFS transporter